MYFSVIIIVIVSVIDVALAADSVVVVGGGGGGGGGGDSGGVLASVGRFHFFCEQISLYAHEYIINEPDVTVKFI